MKEINSLQDIAEESYFLFKHSATCPISSSAHNSVATAEDNINLPVYMVVVQNNRGLSNEIEQHFGIRHESPQLILVRDGKAAWNASHYSITVSTIEKATKDE